jgi:hypothetical protein
VDFHQGVLEVLRQGQKVFPVLKVLLHPLLQLICPKKQIIVYYSELFVEQQHVVNLLFHPCLPLHLAYRLHRNLPYHLLQTGH